METLHNIAQKIIPLFIQMLQHLDPQVWTPLAPHQHKVLCFQIQGLSPLYFQITPEGIGLITQEPLQVDVTFSGPLSAFISFMITKKLSHQELHIRGDIDCAKAFYEVWDQIDIDWEGHLATFLGPTMARLFYKSFQQTQLWLKETWQARQQDIGVFLQDELKVLPAKNEIELFFQAIELLRDDVGRLEAKIRRLQQDLAKRE